MSSLEKKRGDFIALYSFLRRANGEGGSGLFFLASIDRTHGSGLKLHQGRFRLGIRKQVLKGWVFKHWKRLPRQLVNAPSLSVFKRYLGDALNSIL